MSKQYYEIGETFVDEESGKALKCVEGKCEECFYFKTDCNLSYCGPNHIFNDECYIFIEINKTTNQTELTQQLLIDNGWIQLDNENVFELDKIKIFCVDGFACGLQTKQNELIGEPFTTVGELKAIAKSLYKVELEFK